MLEHTVKVGTEVKAKSEHRCLHPAGELDVPGLFDHMDVGRILHQRLDRAVLGRGALEP